MYESYFSDSDSDDATIKYLHVSDIQFSQNNLSSRFQDGRTVEDLIYNLQSGELNADDVPMIEVVLYQGKWFVLDGNRRLYAFKKGSADCIPVTIQSLNDQKIRKQFFQKYTSKSNNTGGTMRNPPPEKRHTSTDSYGQEDHFNDGAFIFTKIVLNWRLQQLDYPFESLKRVSPLPTAVKNSGDYFEHFKPLILEEARACISQGIDKLQPNQDAVSIKLQSSKLSNNYENPCTLTVRRLSKKDPFVKFGSAVLLIHSKFKALQFLGITSPSTINDEAVFNIKVVIEESLRDDYEGILNAQQTWRLFDLAPLVTLQRMYEVCCAKPSLPFLNQMNSNRFNTLYDSDEDDYDSLQAWWQGMSIRNSAYRDKQEDFSSSSDDEDEPNLNPSQYQAVKNFLNSNDPIQLVQGPPGTGKTKMIVELLYRLQKTRLQKKRVLVCAPSNKAIQELAERFLQAYPDACMLYSGVEDKLPDDSPLNAYDLQSYGPAQLNLLRKAYNSSYSLIPDQKKKINRKELSQEWADAFNRLNENFEMMIGRCKFSFNAEYKSALLDIRKIVAKMVGYVDDYTVMLTHKDTINYFKEKVKEYKDALERLFNLVSRALNDESDAGLEMQLLNQSNIIFCTLSVSGRKQFKQADSFDYLIIDEAGQSIEIETLIPFMAGSKKSTGPKRCMLIGDTKQLSATVVSTEAKQRKFNRSLMTHLLEDLGFKSDLLNIQYRMDPKISCFPMKQYYYGAVKDHASMHDKNRVPNALLPLYKKIGPYQFVSSSVKETAVGRSWQNQGEATLIGKYIRYLVKNHDIDVSQDVGVITFYRAQVDCLRNELAEFNSLQVQTVDAFQGCEKKIIIISFVRSNQGAKIGFLEDFRRLNVAMTRAQFGLLMVGCEKTLGKSGADLAALIQHVRHTGAFLKKEEFIQLIEPPKSAFFQPQPDRPKNTNQARPNRNSFRPAPCRFFNGRPDSCRYGDDCKFNHALKKG